MRAQPAVPIEWGPSEGPQNLPRWDSGGEAASVPTRSGLSLEDVVVRHALGAGEVPARTRAASGVMMIPIPARVPSALRAVDGVEAARAVAGIEDVVISVRVGETLVPLPEGASYTGFVFAAATVRRRSSARCARPTRGFASPWRRWSPVTR